MKRKRLMLIGAGLEQVPLIRAAKRLGHWVLATHPSKQGADGFAFADATALVDPRDLPALLELARRHKIAAAASDQCDYSAYAVAYLGERLGFPASRLDQMQLVTNKLRMRQAVSKTKKVLQPAYAGCANFAEVEQAARRIGYPLIVKPVDNRGNFGVNRVDSRGALKGAWLEALANSHSRAVIVERFIEGLMTTVEACFVRRGVFRNLAVSWKKMLPENKRVAMELVYDRARLGDVAEPLFQANRAVVETLGLDFGAVHTEFIVTPKNEAYLVETHNRGGGVHISSKICPAVAGFDTNECLIRLACGEPFSAGAAPKRPMTEGSAVLSFFQFDPGTVAGWAGEEEVARDPRVLDFRMLVKPGDAIKPIIGDATRHAFIIVKGRDYAECSRSLTELKSRIRMRYA